MSKTALVVDDNALNVDSISALLTRQDVAVIGVIRLKEVQAAIASAPPIDVVFLDLEFPDGDGMDYINELRAVPALQGVPIIAYSVHISELNEVRAAGFDGFIGKPLQPSRFPEQLQRILNGENVWDVGQ